MIRGVYLNEMKDDLKDCLDIRKKVFQDELGEYDIQSHNKEEMEIYLLLFDEQEIPVGTARLIFDFDGVFRFDSLAVLPEARNKGYGDFLMHMLLDKARQSGANYLVSEDIMHYPQYFNRYGFVINDNRMVLNLKEYFDTHKCCH